MPKTRPRELPDTSTGRKVLDRYELIAEIARGGMGTVFLARLEGAGGFSRLFAIKLMHPHLATEKQFVTMLLDEARLAARIHHPNAVGIIDICDSDHGYYLVMNYVEGFTLEQILEHPKLDAAERIRIGTRIVHDAAVGLHSAHDLAQHDGTPLDLVHRDVSPSNILVGIDGVGRITDFGVARAAARITSSRPGMIKGKPCYMAPEQARGEELDRRCDVFALGIVLWETLTGKQLFWSDAGDAAMLVRVMHDDIPAPASVDDGVPGALSDVCVKALQRPLEERFGSAREMAIALETAGGMVSTHVLADRMKELFGEQIETRREQISKAMSDMGRASSAVASDVFDVPKLSDRPPPPGDAMPDEDDEDAPRISTSAATRAGVRASREPSEGGWHEEVQTDAGSPPTSGTRPSAQAPQTGKEETSSPMRLALVLIVVGVVLLGLAIVLVSGSGDEPDEERADEASTEPAEPTEPATPDPDPEPDEPQAAAEPVEPAGTGIEETPPDETAAAAEAPDRPAATAMQIRAAASMRARMRSGMGSMGVSSMMAGAGRPALEDNPYLRQ